MDRWHQALGARGAFQVDVPTVGVLDFRYGERDLVLLRDDGGEQHFRDHELLEPPDELVRHEVAEGILIAAKCGHGLYRFCRGVREPETVLTFDRDGTVDHSFLFVRFAVGPVAVLVVYEAGVACLELDGALRWHLVHPRDFQYLGIDRERVLFEDAEARRWTYNLLDGRPTSRQGT